MATIKSYSDLQQSRKLAEILPLESADYHYIIQGERLYFSLFSLSSDAIKYYDEEIKYIPCWSLVGLLSILPNENMLVKTTDGEYYCLAKDVMTKHYDNPVDACVDMIIKLHELDLL